MAMKTYFFVAIFYILFSRITKPVIQMEDETDRTQRSESDFLYWTRIQIAIMYCFGTPLMTLIEAFQGVSHSSFCFPPDTRASIIICMTLLALQTATHMMFFFR